MLAIVGLDDTFLLHAPPTSEKRVVATECENITVAGLRERPNFWTHRRRRSNRTHATHQQTTTRGRATQVGSGGIPRRRGVPRATVQCSFDTSAADRVICDTERRCAGLCGHWTLRSRARSRARMTGSTGPRGPAPPPALTHGLERLSDARNGLLGHFFGFLWATTLSASLTA